MKQTIPVRADADPKYTWALEDIYPSDEAWDAAYAEAQNFSRQISAFRGRLGSSARTLLEFLQLGETISVAFDSLYGYAQRRSDEDTAVSKYQGMSSKAISLMVAVDAAGSFETPELLAIPDEKLDQFYQELPELTVYRTYLGNLRRKRAHILSDAEEKLLA